MAWNSIEIKEGASIKQRLKFFLWDIGLSWLMSSHFIQYHHGAGFYKPKVTQYPPSHLQDYSTCNSARLEFPTVCIHAFDPNEWCMKNDLSDLNP